jgi:hypothetical protein
LESTEVVVARQTTRRESTPEPDEELTDSGRPASVDEFWSSVRVDPIEIALPKGVGYTLRAYRKADEVTATDVSGREDDDLFPTRRHEPEAVEEDEGYELDGEDAGFDEDDQTFDDDESEPDEDEDEDEDEEEDEEEEEEPEDAEEVPVFLGHAGRLYLFRSAEGLVEFVRSDAEHDLAQLDTWPELVKKISRAHVVPLDEDTYELDLVVKNLRGSRDTWDANLIIQAGEVARDLGYALRLEPVIGALSTGSPLDDLDEALRAIEAGGVSGFLARRRLKKIGTEAPPLSWRSIIGNIAAVVDWRD